MKIATIQVLVDGCNEDQIKAILTETLGSVRRSESGMVDYRWTSQSGEQYLSNVPDAIVNAVRDGTYKPGAAFPDDNLRLPEGRDYVVSDAIWLTVERPSDNDDESIVPMSVSVISTANGVDIATFDIGEEMESPRSESSVPWTVDE